MASVKDNLCLVIDLEGFFVEKKFQACEMGYYSWNDHFGRYAFFQSAMLNDLSHKDKKTVNFAKHKIHALTKRELMPKIKKIVYYWDCTTNTRWKEKLW